MDEDTLLQDPEQVPSHLQSGSSLGGDSSAGPSGCHVAQPPALAAGDSSLNLLAPLLSQLSQTLSKLADKDSEPSQKKRRLEDSIGENSDSAGSDGEEFDQLFAGKSSKEDAGADDSDWLADFCDDLEDTTGQAVSTTMADLASKRFHKS